MRRRYYKRNQNKGRDKIRMEALLNMQKARRQIDPALLETVQHAIADAWFSHHSEGEKARIEPDSNGNNTIPVDLKRNLSVIQKFVEMNADNTTLQKQIKSMISENL